jgi:hypothetical protein
MSADETASERKRVRDWVHRKSTGGAAMSAGRLIDDFERLSNTVRERERHHNYTMPGFTQTQETRAKLNKLAAAIGGAPHQLTDYELLCWLWDEAFTRNTTRDPRSSEYKDGVALCLNNKIFGHPIRSAWVPGCAETDAFYAGVEEGHAIWRRVGEE